MKKALLGIGLGLLSIGMQAQDCSNIFISEYLEGWSNNKALEFYNPTDSDLDMADYEIARYQNGSAAPGNFTQLEGTIPAGGTFVVVIDKRDPYGVDFEAPVWDDLQEKADLFINPNYNDGVEVMYYNGNDVLLLREVGGAAVDIFGRPGEDPTEDIPGYSDPEISTQGWPDSNGADFTKDNTLVRKASVKQGRTNPQEEFIVDMHYDTLGVNVFEQLGQHSCECQDVANNTVEWSAISIYPSFLQSGDLINVESKYELAAIEVLSMSGQLVKAADLQITLDGAAFVADAWKPGFYIINMTLTDGRIVSRKLVVQ